MTALIAILAHQGGWDEMLLIGGPILVIAGLLVLAKRRLEGAEAAARSTAELTDTPDTPETTDVAEASTPSTTRPPESP